MDTKLQPSFIPKKPVGGSSSLRPRSINFLSLLGTIILLAFIGVAGGIFAWKQYMESRVVKLQNDLAAARQSLNPAQINELVRLDRRIESSKSLIKGHVALTPFFDLLETATLKRVRFNNFNYELSDKGVVVSMSGQTDSFATVALQADEINKYPEMFREPLFGELNSTGKNSVVFKLTMTLDPKLVSYSDSVVVTPEPPAAIQSSGSSTTTPQ